MNLKQETITFASLLTVSLILINMGIDLIKQGQILYGVILVIVGFGIMMVAIYLYSKGLIRTAREHLS